MVVKKVDDLQGRERAQSTASEPIASRQHGCRRLEPVDIPVWQLECPLRRVFKPAKSSMNDNMYRVVLVRPVEAEDPRSAVHTFISRSPHAWYRRLGSGDPW
jgi:hypothetical protein